MFEAKNSNLNEKTKINVANAKEHNTSHKSLQNSQDNLLPINILSNNILSPLEVIVKYLRENKELTYKEMSVLLSRNPKTLAVTYSIASKKYSGKIIVDQRTIYIDFAIFKTRFSILESICHALRSSGKTHSQISRIIGKSQKTVWTVCHRAEKKLTEKTTGSTITIDANTAIIERVSELPLSILKNKILSPLEVIVKYLRENKDLTYKRISELLSRNSKTLAVTYSVASKKHPEKIIVDPETSYLDFSIFKSKLSILEAICHSLKSSGKKYSQISRIIGKSQKTVWTVCNRVEKKLSQNTDKKSKEENKKET